MYQVMIADDEPNSLNKLAEFIQTADPDFHIISKSFSAEDALFDLRMVRPDLVLTDIRMPVIDGLSLLQQMRATGWDGYAAVITGYNDFRYAQQAIRLNVFEYLVKPVIHEDIAGLLSRTKQLLDEEQAKIAKLRSEIQAQLQQDDFEETEGRLPYHIIQAKAYIKDHYAEPITLTQVAKFVSVSPVYLSASYVKYCEQNFLEYVTHFRITKAKELLKTTNLQVQEIAQKVGYIDVPYFSRVFRRLTGFTPRDFRANTDPSVE